MPLKKGKENIGRNIREMERSGHPKAQAVAAALRTAGVPKKVAKSMQYGPIQGSTLADVMKGFTSDASVRANGEHDRARRGNSGGGSTTRTTGGNVPLGSRTEQHNAARGEPRSRVQHGRKTQIAKSDTPGHGTPQQHWAPPAEEAQNQTIGQLLIASLQGPVIPKGYVKGYYRRKRG